MSCSSAAPAARPPAAGRSSRVLGAVHGPAPTAPQPAARALRAVRNCMNVAALVSCTPLKPSSCFPPRPTPRLGKRVSTRAPLAHPHAHSIPCRARCFPCPRERSRGFSVSQAPAPAVPCRGDVSAPRPLRLSARPSPPVPRPSCVVVRVSVAVVGRAFRTSGRAVARRVREDPVAKKKNPHPASASRTGARSAHTARAAGGRRC